MHIAGGSWQQRSRRPSVVQHPHHPAGGFLLWRPFSPSLSPAISADVSLLLVEATASPQLNAAALSRGRRFSPVFPQPCLQYCEMSVPPALAFGFCLVCLLPCHFCRWAPCLPPRVVGFLLQHSPVTLRQSYVSQRTDYTQTFVLLVFLSTFRRQSQTDLCFSLWSARSSPDILRLFLLLISAFNRSP